MIMDHPFFGCLAMRLHVVARQDIPTLATDGKHLFYSPAFLDKIPDRDLLTIVAHEVLHCALGHMTRRGSRDHNLWNKACDYAVNAVLVNAGFHMPSYGLYDPKYAGLSAEDILKKAEALMM